MYGEVDIVLLGRNWQGNHFLLINHAGETGVGELVKKYKDGKYCVGC